MLSFVLPVLVLTAVVLAPTGSIMVHLAINNRRCDVDHIRLYRRRRPKGHYAPEDEAAIRQRQSELCFDALNHAVSGITPISYSTEPGEEGLRLKQQQLADKTRQDWERSLEVAGPHRRYAA